MRVTPMRIKCPQCHGKAAVYSRSGMAKDLARIYARCSNPECERFGCSFVSHVSFAHWISPSAEAIESTLHLLLSQLPRSERQQLLTDLQKSA